MIWKPEQSIYISRESVDNLEDITTRNKKGYSFIWAVEVSKHFQRIKGDMKIHIYYDKTLEKQPHFRKVFSDGTTLPILYPIGLIQDKKYDYMLNEEEWNKLLNKDWSIKTYKELRLYFPNFDTSMDKEFYLKYYKNDVFLMPVSKENINE